MGTPWLSKQQLIINEIIKTYLSYKTSKYKVLTYYDFEKYKDILDADMNHIIEIYTYLKKDKTNNKKFKDIKDQWFFRSYLDKIRKIQDEKKQKEDIHQTLITDLKLNEFTSMHQGSHALSYAENIQKLINNDFKSLDNPQIIHYKNGVVNAIKDIFKIDNKEYIEKLLHSDYILNDRITFKSKVEDTLNYYKYLGTVVSHVKKKHPTWKKLNSAQKQSVIDSYTLRNKQIITSENNLKDFKYFLTNYGLNQVKKATVDKLLSCNFTNMNEKMAKYIIERLVKK